MTDADYQPSIDEALEWFESEQRNLSGLVSQLRAYDEPDEAIEDLVTGATDFYMIRGMWREWEDMLEAALESAERRGDHRREASLHGGLGNALLRQNRLVESREQSETALRIAEGHGVAEVVPAALATIASIDKRERRPDLAIGRLERAQDLYREVGNRRGEAQAIGDLANNLDDLGRADEALSLHEQAAALFQDLGDRFSEMKERGNAAIALLNLARWGEAEAALRSVIEASSQFGSRRDEAAAWRDLALALAEQDRFDEAQVAIRRASDLVVELDNPYEEGLVREQAARVFMRTGELDRAREMLERNAEELEGTNLVEPAASAQFGLGSFLFAHGEDEPAAEAFKRAIQISRGPNDLAALRARLGLGAIALNAGQPGYAYEHAVVAMEGFRELHRLADLREALRLLGAALLELGRVGEAEAVAQELAALDEGTEEPPS